MAIENFHADLSADSDYIDFLSLLTRNNVTFGQYSHLHNHINIIVTGECTVSANGKDYHLAKGNAIFFPKNQKYNYNTGGYSQVAVEMKDISSAGDLQYLSSLLPGDIFVFPSPNITQSNYYEFKKLILDTSKLSKLLIKNKAESIVLSMIDSLSNSSEKFRSNFLRIVSQNDLRSLSLESISKEFHYSKGHTEKLMQQYFGCGVAEYLHKLKLDTASHLLLETDYTISQIAEITGFFDIAHFTSCFKRYMNKTPSKFRKEFISASEKSSV